MRSGSSRRASIGAGNAGLAHESGAISNRRRCCSWTTTARVLSTALRRAALFPETCVTLWTRSCVTASARTSRMLGGTTRTGARVMAGLLRDRRRQLLCAASSRRSGLPAAGSVIGGARPPPGSRLGWSGAGGLEQRRHLGLRFAAPRKLCAVCVWCLRKKRRACALRPSASLPETARRRARCWLWQRRFRRERPSSGAERRACSSSSTLSAPEQQGSIRRQHGASVA
mmetsp:Transcript_7001/g.14555  ORF Transcript_7001/g.14555 Transcript_7001/m.14555 type:complete len:228 (-) Transcript_7001:92-775(-)